VAVGLAEASFPNRGVRILTFVGGACTSGPGTIVNEPLKETIRSHHDIEKDDIPHMRKAAKVWKAPRPPPLPKRRNKPDFIQRNTLLIITRGFLHDLH
jgi:hypothetical protein